MIFMSDVLHHHTTSHRSNSDFKNVMINAKCSAVGWKMWQFIVLKEGTNATVENSRC
jgi:hypothetical protein